MIESMNDSSRSRSIRCWNRERFFVEAQKTSSLYREHTFSKAICKPNRLRSRFWELGPLLKPKIWKSWTLKTGFLWVDLCNSLY